MGSLIFKIEYKDADDNYPKSLYYTKGENM